MEEREPQPRIKAERFRSFDVLASIDLYQYDLMTYGQVLPETKQRVCDEELTYIAEGINRPLRTEFVLQEQNGQLVYFDRGQWKPYIGTLIQGFQVAEHEAQLDPRKTFMAERAARDLSIGYEFLKLKPGEKMAWHSSYPKQEEAKYGSEFIGSLGFQPKREMGFLYHAEREIDGSLVLITQSVDNSDDEAFKNAYAQGSDIDAMRAAYDATLSYKRRGSYFAGREMGQTAIEENAWEAINQHQDLLKWYFEHLEGLAQQSNGPRAELELAKKRLTYGVWAALRERFDRQSFNTGSDTLNTAIYQPQLIRDEVSRAYQILSARGEKLFGCGGTIKGEEALLNASSEDVFDAVFGDKAAESKNDWKWKQGICRVDGCPTRPGKTKVGPCDVCTHCQDLYDKGKDPIHLYGSRRVKG